ncbi:DOPA 4,5-dioxygenase family protein [Vibrio sp. SS-MA-C1-2]|uniref:DOPA 4,5-dioxygenase family protein n=1 Tax=Vibrio sp. SS-MA-C1-2 TaxID=2908646 RepID=UPI001F1A42B9|nr:DOPA 4,5-dioxygenase family protein [Vibrio sp. SS-MA-C1-2]UJF19838.1 DOPA 4,5-dioxygenase family protein [Vibrio sp. SS-MA-C1-2]
MSKKQDKTPKNSHQHYHAHLYFDQKTQDHAKELRHLSEEIFGLKVGRFHQKLVGPHPCWSCQIEFNAEDFDQYIAWLESQRQQLSVLIHPVTGDDLIDHTDYAYWLGQEIPLNLALFR